MIDRCWLAWYLYGLPLYSWALEHYYDWRLFWHLHCGLWLHAARLAILYREIRVYRWYRRQRVLWRLRLWTYWHPRYGRYTYPFYSRYRLGRLILHAYCEYYPALRPVLALLVCWPLISLVYLLSVR